MRRYAPAPALRVEPLEDRFTPAVTLDFDFTYDTTGFFADPARRAALEQAGDDLVGRLTATPAAITPNGGDRWTASFFDPATGSQVRMTDMVIPEGVLKVFVGSRDLGGAAAAQGGYGGYGAAGAAGWFERVATRGQAFSVWGGSLTFDPGQNWYFGPDAAGLTTGQADFYTVATHELAHLLGFGTAPTFTRQVVGGVFTGATATAVYGSAPSVAPDGAHWAAGLESGGQPASLQPALVPGRRYGLSPLDYAALTDIGWMVGASPLPVPVIPPLTSPPPAPVIPPTVPPTIPPTVPPTVPPPPVVPPTVPPTSPFAGGVTAGTLALGGLPGGAVQLFNAFPDGERLGGAVPAFPGFGGVVRAATADVNADGTPDVAVAAGPGGGSLVRVIDGATGADLLPAYSAFEAGYSGGLFVAAADLDRDGRAEVIVSPDRGGGGRVTVLAVAGGTARVAANFFGIEDVNFRGGARVAAADVSGDGVPDVVVGAGFGGGPRVAVFDGASVATRPRKLVNDFYAFDGPDAVALRNGVFPAAGDLNADGRADLVFGGGPGGGPRVFALSGLQLTSSPDVAKAAPLANFFAFPAAERGGVRAAVKDVTRDGIGDLVLGSGEGVAGRLAVYAGGAGWAGGTPTATAAADPFGFAFPIDGVYVG